jgi:hypothetical protein
VIVEHEVIEQIEEEAQGRRLDWVCALIRGLCDKDPLPVLQGMWRAGLVALVDDEGPPLRDWRCTELIRTCSESAAVHVVATGLGSSWVDGQRGGSHDD